MSSNHRISLDVPENAASITDLLNLKANSSESISRLSDYLASIGSGQKLGKVRINTGAVQAAGTVTFSSFADADTVTLNGVTLTGKTSPSGASQWAVGASDEACANNFAAKVNASALDKIVGVLIAIRRATVALSAFVDADTITINGHIFTGKTTPDAGSRTQFAIGSTDTITAVNLVAAVTRSLSPLVQGVAATSSSTTVTLNFNGTLTVAASAHATVTSTIAVMTSIVAGQIGNLCTLAISAHGAVSAANLASGTEGTEVIFAKNYAAA